MAEELPYLVAPKRFPEFLTAIQTAAVPPKITSDLLKKMGFASSNDRAFPGLLKRLGFLGHAGEPTERYKAFRQKTEAKRVLGEGIREAYKDVFALNTNAHSETKENVKGLISRVTDKDQRIVDLVANTFLMLCGQADFDPVAPALPKTVKKNPDDEERGERPRDRTDREPSVLSFRHNIEIHLPATTDIAVYNAIFKSLRAHLGE